MNKLLVVIVAIFFSLSFIGCSNDDTGKYTVAEFSYLLGDWDLQSLIYDGKEQDLSEWSDEYAQKIGFYFPLPPDIDVDGTMYIYLKNEEIRHDNFTWYFDETNRKLKLVVTSIIDSNRIDTEKVYYIDETLNNSTEILTLREENNLILTYERY